MTTPAFVVLFVIFFALTLLSSYVGDDDVVYRYMENNAPTGTEGIARIRYVIVKTIASISGGTLIAAGLAKLVLQDQFSVTLSHNQVVLLAVTCISVASLLIGCVQNVVRVLQRRTTRPVFDVKVFRYNNKTWFDFFGFH